MVKYFQKQSFLLLQWFREEHKVTCILSMVVWDIDPLYVVGYMTGYVIEAKASCALYGDIRDLTSRLR